MDILQLVDRLEELVDNGTRVPLSAKVAIDEEAYLNIIDQMRIMIPQEIKLAREVQREKDKYIAQANEEARRIISQAREDAAKALDAHELRAEAEAQADEILGRAREEAARIRVGADNYAEEILRELAQTVSQIEDTLRNGLTAIEEDRRLAQSVVSSSESGSAAEQQGPAADKDAATATRARAVAGMVSRS